MKSAAKLLSEELIEERREEQRRENEQDAASPSPRRRLSALSARMMLAREMWARYHGVDGRDYCEECHAAPSAARTPERKRLFWKQIEQARKDVGEWPNYLKHAFGVKPLDR